MEVLPRSKWLELTVAVIAGDESVYADELTRWGDQLLYLPEGGGINAVVQTNQITGMRSRSYTLVLQQPCLHPSPSFSHSHRLSQPRQAQEMHVQPATQHSNIRFVELFAPADAVVSSGDAMVSGVPLPQQNEEASTGISCLFPVLLKLFILRSFLRFAYACVGVVHGCRKNNWQYHGCSDFHGFSTTTFFGDAKSDGVISATTTAVSRYRTPVRS